MASAGGSSNGVVTGSVDNDCEGEEPEDSSNSNDLDVNVNFDNLTLQDDTQSTDTDDELSLFRRQWQRELEPAPAAQMEPKPKQVPEEPLSDEDRAKQLFLRGAEMERGGKLYEAIQHYKRAMQILPDVERRLYESLDNRADTPEEEIVEVVERADNADESDDEDAVEGEDLLSRLQRITDKKGVVCESAHAVKDGHISWLPYEVLMLLLRWVVSSDLDAASLERVGGVCRGLYVASRSTDLWRSLCFNTWGIDCGTPRSHGFPSWRQMYIERPRLLLHGCYISKTTYLRHGENSFQDQSYRPWYLIDYYRYLRFFSDGAVLMWTTAEEPAACVALLRQRPARASLGISCGHYRLMGDKVVVVVKKVTDKKTTSASNTRFRARRKETDSQEQTFHMEFQLRDVRSRRNWQLAWRRYGVCARRDQWTHFELSPGKFPPFAFSRVRAYSADAAGPLPSAYYS